MSSSPTENPTSSRSRPEPTTRVDPAHAANLEDGMLDSAPLDLLQAIAGHDAAIAPQQLRGQALELASLLKEKQRLLEQRESELNARTALLENELRSVRLKQFHDRPSLPLDTLADEMPSVDRIERLPSLPELPEPPNTPDLRQLPELPELTGDLRLLDETDDAWDRPLIETDLSEEARRAAPDRDSGAGQNHPAPPAKNVAADQQQRELDGQYEHLEQQRQQLRQREIRLDQRRRAVEQMQDEVLQLHREALELRFTTEQVWADLMEEFPSERLTQSLAEARARLADHYRLANDALSRRKDELHAMRMELNTQEQQLRQQRREIQMWADRRYDEIEARLAKLILRERELDQLEGEYQRQTLVWQQQREAYREEIERLRPER